MTLEEMKEKQTIDLEHATARELQFYVAGQHNAKENMTLSLIVKALTQNLTYDIRINEAVYERFVAIEDKLKMKDLMFLFDGYNPILPKVPIPVEFHNKSLS